MSEGAAVDGGTVTAGQLLREAREAAGLHAATLAATLKVPLRKLEALEADRYEELPDAVFVRALASSICRTLKIDAQPVLERLPQTAQPRLAQDGDGINAPFRAAGTPQPGLRAHVFKPVPLLVVALLLATVVVMFLPQRDDGVALPAASPSDPVMPPGTPATVTAAPAEPRGPDGAVMPATPASAPIAGAMPAAPAAPATTVATASTATLPAPAAGAASAAIPAATPASAAASAPAAAGVVTFRTTGESWVQVTDAGGTTVLRRLMAAGETAGANGTLPLAVTVGNIGATEVRVRGQPFNLQPVSRDNVARFEVK